jgi:hypothetical protein
MPAFSAWVSQVIVGAMAFAHAASGSQLLPTQPAMAEEASGAPQREVGDVAMRFEDEGPIEFCGTFVR